MSFFKNFPAKTFSLLSIIIIMFLFVIFGLLLYFQGYNKGIDKASQEYIKQKQKLINIINTPCANCIVKSDKYNRLSQLVLKKILQINKFNKSNHTIQEYKLFFKGIEKYYYGESK